jgi:6-phosphogluconolactonase
MSFETVIDEQPVDILVPKLERLAREAIAARGRFAIALPGGSVATSCFPRFAEARVDWSKVHFFWGDERAVPATHPDSNYGVAEKLWLAHIATHAPVVHRMEADAPDLDEAARRYERTLRESGPIDLALLGMGPDGHVCSLFPGHALLDETERLALPILDSPKPPPRRLTLTLPALAMAMDVIVVATGAGKADAVKELRTSAASRLPVALALNGARRGTLVLDPAASG